MTREWKPGDVAMLPTTEGWTVALRQERQWATTAHLYFNDWAAGSARPLVVIDPEDSRGIAVEIAQRVGNALHVMPGRDISAGIEAVQEALREFADPKPPKPEEPMGLGAVVEDVDGHKWVRVEELPPFGPWYCGVLPEDECSIADGAFRQFSDIDAVKVLSEGVTGGAS